MLYLFSGILLGVGFYLSHYLLVDKIMHYLASPTLKIGVTKIQVLGFQLIASFSSLIGGIFLLIGLKKENNG